jgi:hypothetical protein
MRTYRAGRVPTKPEEIPAFLSRELAAIERAASASEPYMVLDVLHAYPAKLFDGLVIQADGTDLDPGSGAGVYVYYGAAWHKLG